MINRMSLVDDPADFFDELTAMAEVNSNVHEFFLEDPTVVSVMRKMESRSQEGMKTYGKSMRTNDMEILEWLENLQEELLDGALYAEEAMHRMKEKEGAISNE